MPCIQRKKFSAIACSSVDKNKNEIKYQYYFSFTFLTEHTLLYKVNGRHKINLYF